VKEIPTSADAPEAVRPVSAEQLAEDLGCSAQHIRNQIHAGEIRAVRVGKIFRVPRSEWRRLVLGEPDAVA